MRAEGKDPEDFFLSLAASISDESKVDWDQAEESATGEHREVVHYLRAISRIAAANRTADWGLDAEEPGREEQQEGLGRWGHLELLEKIADGAFGEVYRARDPNLDCEMALKLLRRETSESPDGTEVICEGRLLAKVCHPNVAKVHGAERHWGRAGVWMEFIRGRNLEDLLEEQGRFGWDYATLIGQDLCRALAAVHQAGILHRDVKTKNVMREEGGRIVLMDFGLGRETWLLEQQEILSATGTPPYMAPELFRRQPPTTQSDIYSLGVVLFRLVSGRYPVEGNSYMDLSRAHEEGRRNLLSDVRPDLPEAFVRVVEKGIEADPSQRYASAGEFEHALASARGEIREEERRRSAPVRLLRGLGVAAAVTIVMLAWMVWGPGASYDVEAALFRVAGGGTEHLFPGATIAPGDQLLLEFEGSTDLHVYVVSRDDKGEAYLLFPMSRSSLKNPLQAGVKHRLPGTRDDMQLVWNVTSAGGREHLMIVASPERLKDFEADVLALDRPQESGGGQASSGGDASGYARIPERAMVRLRGVGGIGKQPLPAAPGKVTDVFGEIQELAVRSESARGAWVRQIDLEYAKP